MKGLLLLSGGFDSAVAGYMVKRLNVELIAVHFHYLPLSDKASIEKCRDISSILGIKKLYLIPLIDFQKRLVENDKRHRLFYVITKRFLNFVANKIAREEDCDFIITGENLGQVSSQTLTNMAVIDKAKELPIIRPLLTFNKNEIIKKAQEIGTFDISKGPELCSLLGPKFPATKSSLKSVEIEEESMKINKLVEESLDKKEIIDVAV